MSRAHTDARLRAVNHALLRPHGATPAPDDLAAIIAGWSARDQAQFLISLGFAIEGKPRREAIAHQIVAEELGLAARFGSYFILAIAKVVGDAQKTEAAP